MKSKKNKDFSFRKHSWRQFKKNKPALISFYFLCSLIFIFIFADLIANDQPLYAEYRGNTYFPAISSIIDEHKTDTLTDPATGKTEILQFDITDWRQLKLDKVVWAPIPYSPGNPDPYNRTYRSPFEKHYYKNSDGEIVEAPYLFRHHLGTTQIGVDLAAGIIHGTRISLLIGIISVGIAALIGLFLGSASGYYGDTMMVMSRSRYYFSFAGICLGFFYAFLVRKYALQDAMAEGIFEAFVSILISVIILILFIRLFGFLGRGLHFIPFFRRDVTVPVDSIIVKSIEILNSIPRLILIITIAALFKEKSIFLVMAIIGLTTWTGIARFTRAEFLRTRTLDYIQASRALGFSQKRIIFRHALPNSLAPVFVAIAFGIASAILIESSLSFLGIGVPDDIVTWGSLLSAGRQRFEAWWMILFPGIAIFLTVTIYNLIGEGLRDATDPKLKN